jgi:hypothetical protein
MGGGGSFHHEISSKNELSLRYLLSLLLSDARATVRRRGRRLNPDHTYAMNEDYAQEVEYEVKSL